MEGVVCSLTDLSVNDFNTGQHTKALQALKRAQQRLCYFTVYITVKSYVLPMARIDHIKGMILRDP